MSFLGAFLISLAFYAALCVGYFLYARTRRQKRNFIKFTPLQKTYELQNSDKNPCKIDIAGGLVFLASSLNEDAAKNRNRVIFDYDIAYPRIFYADIDALAKLIDALAQIFLKSVSDSTVTIKFLLSNYYKDNVKFTISAASKTNFFVNKNPCAIHINMSKKSRKFYRLAQALARKNGSDIWFEFGNTVRISTEISLKISSRKLDTVKNIKIKNPKNFIALIAHPDASAFYALKKYLDFIGIDVKPCREWDVVKRHVRDMIFRPDVVFIDESLLQSIDESLQNDIAEKKIALVVLKNTSAQTSLNPKIRVLSLPQLYLPDMLVCVLNEAYEFKMQNGDKI